MLQTTPTAVRVEGHTTKRLTARGCHLLVSSVTWNLPKQMSQWGTGYKKVAPAMPGEEINNHLDISDQKMQRDTITFTWSSEER